MILGFWGLTVFPEKTYTQVVDNSFKLSMAALDEVIKPGRTSIRVTVDKKTFILCSLTPGKVEQQNLDIVFTEGEEITFSVSGDTAVHLSGNYLPEDDDGEYADEDDMYGDIDGVSDDDDEDDDSDENAIVTKGAKRLAQFEMDSDDDEDSEEDPDFTGEDDEDDEDEEDDDEEEGVEGQAGDEDDEDDDNDEDDEDEDEDDEDDEEELAEAVKKLEALKKEEAAKKEAKKKQEAAAKKQKVSEDKAVTTKPKEEAPKKKEEHKKTLPNGLVIEDVKAGEGARAKSGKKIGMRYIGRLANGKVFDKNTGGKPFSFNLGRGEVIKGWDLGIQGMQLGGERRLTIPPALAYGSRGAPPDIPPNSTLVFEVKLISLK
ncbi:peptidylprolyl isomerase fpr4 [Podila verticillata]|nr:peptidylprolyl isomerase fpr4 [Podila verticillata]KFH66865.1 peptidylprolyl isomerase [Podila verticillata NRRL 6337]